MIAQHVVGFRCVADEAAACVTVGHYLFAILMAPFCTVSEAYKQTGLAQGVLRSIKIPHPPLLYQVAFLSIPGAVVFQTCNER